MGFYPPIKAQSSQKTSHSSFVIITKNHNFPNYFHQMNFKSNSQSQSHHPKTMDFIDVDQVPDTPDRVVGASGHSNESYSNGRRHDALSNNRIHNKDYTNGRMRSQPVNGKLRLFTHPDSSSSPQVVQSFKNCRPSIDTARHDKGKAVCNSDGLKSTRPVGCSFSGVAENNASRKGVLPVNSLDRSSKICTVNNSPKTVPSFDRGKGVDIEGESNASACMQPCTSFKVPRKRMLVRNGCISPNNIAKAKVVELKDESVSKVKELQNGSGTGASSNDRSNTVNIKDLIAEAKDSRRYKGKEVYRHVSSEETTAGSSHLPQRRHNFKAPAESSSDCNVDTNGWRTTHNHRKNGDIGQYNNRSMQRELRNERDIQHLSESVIVSSPSVHDLPQTISPHAHNLGNNRQREDSASKSHPKRSVSCIDESVGEPSTSRTKRKKSSGGAGPSNPMTEPNTNNESSSFRDLQIEADEMLARELQEQLYGEEPTLAVQLHEMDTPLAFSMPPQQGNRSRSAGGRQASRRPGASLLNAPEEVQPSTSSRLHSFRRLRQPRHRASSRMAQLRSQHRPMSSTSNQRNSMFPPNMDVELRLEILETLEAARNLRMPSEFLPLRREFTEDDYEMLLALDDNNHQHGGATRAQINNLPESKVQAENLQECAICLETPTIGETIRHLPCLHRFHKECIDQWLGRKTLCMQIISDLICSDFCINNQSQNSTLYLRVMKRKDKPAYYI